MFKIIRDIVKAVNKMLEFRSEDQAKFVNLCIHDAITK